MLLGCDISHHNSPKTFNYRNCGKFAIIKASEGAGYVDPCYLTHFHMCLDEGVLTGLYHYCRAERNSAEIEAKNFIARCKSVPYEYNLLALDIEGEAWNNPNIDTWALNFCKYVYESVGAMPLIYVSASYASRFPICSQCNVGLWLAWYNNEPEKVKASKWLIPWDVVAIHQYTSSPYDKDCFFGNEDAWLAYGGKPAALADETVHAGDSVSDALRSAQILAELENIVNRYKGL